MALAVTLVALALLFLWKVREAVIPFLAAMLLAVVVDPLIRASERRGWPRGRSVPLLFLLITTVIGGGIVWGVPALYNQVTNVLSDTPHYLAQVQNQSNALLRSSLVRKLPANFRAPLEEQIRKSTIRAAEHIPTLLTDVSALFGATISRLFWLIITLLATFYLMLDLPLIGFAIRRAVPARHRHRTTVIGSQVAEVFSNYLRGLIIVCTLYGLAVTAVLLPFRIPNMLALGFMAGVLYMVPYVGALMTTLVVGIVAFVAFGVGRALVVIAVLTLIHQVFDYGITPRILGHQVGLHPLASLFAMVTAGALFGIWGVLLAVPVAASIVVALKNLYPRLMRPLPSEEAVFALNAESEAAAFAQEPTP